MKDMDYAFNATALGIGGVREHAGVTTIFPSLGSVVLPSTGGEGSSDVLNYNSNGISFGSMHTRVSGARVTEKLFSTTSQIQMSYLNLFGRVRVNQLRLTLTSTRRVDKDDEEARFEVHASYGGVIIDDEEVIPQLDIDMCSFETYADFLQAARRNTAAIAEKLEEPVDAVKEMVARPVPPVVRGSIVADVKKRRDTRLAGRRNKVHVPGLGKVQFGELILKQGRRRINLLRLDFGDRLQEGPETDNGSLVIASGEGNGTPIWPNSGP
jgi:hypothetical protein